MHEPSHSPSGFLWQIAAETGWSVDYILHGINYQALLSMMMDAPRYVEKSSDDDYSEDMTEEEAMEAEVEAMTKYYQSL